MKILTIPLLAHDASICILEDGEITSYQMEERFSRNKHDLPMLMNTSFNLGGEPLVETFNHAVHTLKNSMIEYLYLPEIETLVTVKNKKLLYQ